MRYFALRVRAMRRPYTEADARGFWCVRADASRAEVWAAAQRTYAVLCRAINADGDPDVYLAHLDLCDVGDLLPPCAREDRGDECDDPDACPGWGAVRHRRAGD